MPEVLLRFVRLLNTGTAMLSYAPGPLQQLEIHGKIKPLEIIALLGCPRGSCGEMSRKFCQYVFKLN